MKKACQYAVVQFMPYPETREFANIGVVLLCAEDGYFGFRMLTQRYGRITNFFENLERQVFIKGRKFFHDELTRIRNTITQERRDTTTANHLFVELTRRREGMFRFDEPAVLLTDDPAHALDEQFNFYVEHEFATKEYQERMLEKTVRNLLKTARLADRYKDETIGDDMFHARFPFVAMDGDQPKRVIKPLFLGHDDPIKIYAHGDLWLPKVKRLRARNLLPHDVMFPLTAPKMGDTRTQKAFTEIRGELQAMDIQITDAAEQQNILRFAEQVL